jgi:hypothetical protein
MANLIEIPKRYRSVEQNIGGLHLLESFRLPAEEYPGPKECEHLRTLIFDMSGEKYLTRKDPVMVRTGNRHCGLYPEVHFVVHSYETEEKAIYLTENWHVHIEGEFLSGLNMLKPEE